MRDAPHGVGRIAVETSTQLIEHAPAGHSIQCFCDQFQNSRISRALVDSQKQRQLCALWELGLFAETTVFWIKGLPPSLSETLKHMIVRHRRVDKAPVLLFVQPGGYLPDYLVYFCTVVLPGIADTLQQQNELRPRHKCASHERHTFRRQK